MNTRTVRQRKRRVRTAVALVLVMGAVQSPSIARTSGANARAQETPSADDAWRKFDLHPSFRIDLVVSEPTIAAPDAIAWDARERTWLCVGGERIVVLAATAEENATVFVSGLSGATGFAFYRDGLLVADASGISWLRDTDGDDRVDERTVVLPVRGRIGGMRWGLDGWIHAAFTTGEPAVAPAVAPGETKRAAGEGSGAGSGDEPEDETGADRFAHVPSGLVRFRADGSAFESVLAHPALRGLDFTWDGEVFFSSDATHAAHLVLPDAAFSSGRVGAVTGWIDSTDHSFIERSPRSPLVGRGFTTPGGSCVYEGDAWPVAFSGNHFSSEPVGGLVHRDVLAPWGVAFRAKRAAEGEFLASRDPHFRPTHLAVGPDGALYVLDRYADDPALGRVWRIQHTAVVEAAVKVRTPLPSLNANAQMRELGSPSRWRRMTAHRLLAERGLTSTQRTELANLALESDNAWLTVHALWLARDSTELIRASLVDYDASVRRNALAVAGTSERLDRRLTAADIRARAHDGVPRVALEALRAWSARVDGPSHLEFVELYPKLEDDWSRSAALAIAGKRPATTLAVVLKRGAEADFYDLVRLLALDVARRDSLRDAVSMVLTLREGKAPPRLVSIVLRTLYDELDEGAKPWSSPRLSTTLRHLSSDEDLVIASAALPLARRWLDDQLGSREVSEWSARLHAVVADPMRGLESRLAGLDTLLEIPEARAQALGAAEGFFAPSFPPAAQSRVAVSVGSLEVIEAAHALARGFALMAGEPRDIAFERLFAKPAWTAVLLDAVDAGRISAADLGPDRIARLRAHPDADLAARASQL